MRRWRRLHVCLCCVIGLRSSLIAKWQGDRRREISALEIIMSGLIYGHGAPRTLALFCHVNLCFRARVSAPESECVWMCSIVAFVTRFYICDMIYPACVWSNLATVSAPHTWTRLRDAKYNVKRAPLSSRDRCSAYVSLSKRKSLFYLV